MRRRQTAFKYFMAGCIAAACSVLMVASATYLYLNPKLPEVQALREANLQMPLRVYAKNGELIGVFGEKFRTPLRMEQVPKSFIDAILAAEDDRFLEHRGVDLAGLLRAALELVTSGEIQSGGSTITMQVARNFFLSSEQTFLRKFNEILLALKIERLLSKDEILELYINKIYLGKRAYGVAAASAIYYGKEIDELSIAQLAMIAGLPKAPSSFNPVTNPERALTRRNWILGRMHKLGFIDAGTLEIALAEPVTASYHGPSLALDAGYAAEMARAFAVARFGEEIYSHGIKVITTIEPKLQRAADRALVGGLEEYNNRHGYRGPEKRLGKISAGDAVTVLAKIPEVHGTFAVMLQKLEAPEGEGDARSQKFLALDASGNSSLLQWQAQDNPLQRFIDENRRAPAVKELGELFAPGDVIRIRRQANDVAFITHLPEAAAALVALDPFDGAIRAVVGGYDFSNSKFNRATQAYRQPGSNFKPFIYAAAFEKGYTAASIINDAPIVFNDAQLETDWRPENASGKFYGPTTLRRALYLSRNLVSVRLLREMGIDEAISYLERFKLSAGKFPRDLSLALGSYTMTPLEVASLYAGIANGGYRIQPYIVSEIRDREDRPLYFADPALACDLCMDNAPASSGAEPADTTPAKASANVAQQDKANAGEPELQAEPQSPGDNLEATSDENPMWPLAIAPRPSYAERVIEERVAFILDSILQDVVQRGTGARANELGRTDLAGKTGTTNGPTDAWFSGYHPQLVATAWLGFDDNRLLGKREFGGSAALPIWMKFMGEALRGVPPATRRQPEGMVAVKIDRLTGLPPTATSTQTLFEKFREENAPVIDAESDLLRGNVQVELHEELF